MQKDVTRRTFVSGAGAVAATMAGIAGTGIARAAETTEAAEAGDAASGAAAAPAIETISADVVVIGAGGAGVRAALAAREGGADVVILDKKAWGHCGDSGMHYSGRMTSSDFGIDGDDPMVHLEDAVQQGEYVVDQTLGQQVLQAYADEHVTLMSENYGDIHFRDVETGLPIYGMSKTRNRLWPGFKLNNMGYAALAAGVHALDYCTATKVLTDAEGNIAGVVAHDFRTGALKLVRCKAIVVATGGDMGLWGAGLVSSRYGGGAENLTGDGHALVAPLGVRFRDLEFRSVMPFLGVVFPTGISNFGIVFASDQGVYTDVDGNPLTDELIEQYGGFIPCRQVMQTWYETVAAGKATEYDGLNGIVPDPESTLTRFGHSCEAWHQLLISYREQGADIEHVEAAPQMLYDQGGIVTDIDGATNVPGVFAAGECAMHSGAGYGAFRMFSSALVMGKHAGASAAQFALAADLPAVPWDDVAAEVARIEGLLTNEPGDEAAIRPHELKHRIQDTAWKGSGAIRSEARCDEALAELDDEAAAIANVRLADKSRACNLEWAEAIALDKMVSMARLDTLAARERKESRGPHMRAEYPDMDNENWLKTVYLQVVDGQIEVSVEDTDLAFFQPEAGLVPQGGTVMENF